MWRLDEGIVPASTQHNLAFVGQATGLIHWPDLANLVFVVGISVAFLSILTWAILKDRKDGTSNRGPVATRTLNAAFSATGMANCAVIIVFGVGAYRDQDFAIWLYYAAIVFALQAAAWYMAWTLKRKGWMLATALGERLGAWRQQFAQQQTLQPMNQVVTARP